MPDPTLDTPAVETPTADPAPRLDQPPGTPKGLASFDDVLSQADDIVLTPEEEAARAAREKENAPEKPEEEAPPGKDEPTEKSPYEKENEPATSDDLPDFENLDAELDTDAAPDEESDDVPDDVKEQGEKATARWKELKEAEKENKTLKAQLDQLRQDTEKAGSEDLQKKLEAAQNQIAEQEKYLKATNLQNSAEYREKVTEPLAAYEKAIMDFFPEDEREKGDAIVDALLKDMPGATRARIIGEQIEDYPEMARTEMYNLVRGVQNAFTIRDGMMRDSEKLSEEIQQQTMAETARQKETRIKAYQTLSESVFSKMIEKLPGLKGEDGKPLPEIKGIHENLQGIDFRDVQDSTAVMQAYSAQLLPKVANHLADRIRGHVKEIADLKATIKDLKGAEPGGGGGEGSDGGGGGSAKPKSFIDALDEQIAAGKVTWH